MNWKKSIAVALSAIAVMAMVAGCGSNTATNDQKKIGVIQLVEHPSLDAANKGFVDGLAAKGYKDGQNIKIDQQNAQADQSNLNSIAQRFVSDKKDLQRLRLRRWQMLLMTCQSWVQLLQTT